MIEGRTPAFARSRHQQLRHGTRRARREWTPIGSAAGPR